MVDIAAGFRRMVMQANGLSSGQIDTIERLTTQYPALTNLNLRDVITNPAMADLKNDVLRMLDNPQLAEQFGRQMQADPTLVDRMNHLIANDPAKLRTMLPEFERTPDRLAGLLNESVTPQQAQVARDTAAAGPQGNNPLMSGLQDFLKSLGNLSFGDICKVLIGLIQGAHGLATGLVSGMMNFGRSGELVVTGNGVNDPNSPLRAAATMVGANPTLNIESPDGVRTVMMADLDKQTLETRDPALATRVRPDAAIG